MLNTILMVTVLAPQLERVETAYREAFDYRVIARGRVSAALSASWSAPAIAGREYLLLGPASGAPVYLRFIAADVESPVPHRTEGWNAVELIVQDVDALAARLEDSSHFTVAALPRFLSEGHAIRAMQVLGPAGEMLYLTQLVDASRTAFTLPPADSFVDETFIVVAGARSHERLVGFYRERLKLAVSPPRPYRIGVLSRAFGLPEEREHLLAVASLAAPGFYVELDALPQAASPRAVPTDGLPPGIALVSFGVDSLAALDLPWLVPPDVRRAPPYDGRRSATVRGAAGELLELVELGEAPDR